MTLNLPAGLPLTARPPLFQFTHSGRYVWSNCGVFLLDYRGQPHWFATDGYSAMLTPALDRDGDADNRLFSVSVGTHRAYRTDHIKNLFKYVKGRKVLCETSTGMLYSPDGIMHVPPFTHGTPEEPEPVTLPDVYSPFQGTPTPQDGYQFDLKLVSAIRGAFSHLDRSAEIQMTFFNGERVLLEIEAPYHAQVLISAEGNMRGDDEPKPAEDTPPVDPDQPPLLDGEAP
ncbi:hypothetical protein K7W42_19230 [Deinococcus sp. HMF7604]|uniref:hypothetical protein n=1 Tax=Deinococcus betulae TaxID=2873312 RepID=UPI001CCF697D|nr:hypothetical protein [Deinococcus betulae]MBZ9752974.1 hypothetical protein [Deinococcus betulae]